MKRHNVEAALAVGQTVALNHQSRGTAAPLTRCAFARGVLAFLEELNGSASWWQRIVLGVVRDLVRGVLADCRPQD